MPVVTQPNVIELSDFSSGWLPDLEESTLPITGLLGSRNLLPDIGTRTLVTRKGYKRVATGLPQGWRVMTLIPYNRVSGTTTGRYLMAVLTNGVNNAANNVQVWALNLSTATWTKVSPAGRVWVSGNARHWGATINNIYYGGGPGNTMYKWDPDGGWDSDPSVQNFKTWTVAASATNLGTQSPSDYSFERGDQVLYNDGVHGVRAYSADRDIRHPAWKLDDDYKVGQRVSLRTTHGVSGLTYMRTYVCTKKHTSAAGNKPPATGQGLWDRVQLGVPSDDDSNVGRDWNLIPQAAITNIAVWHGNRLFMRYDNVGPVGKTRLQYSAPSKFVVGTSSAADILQVAWDPKDFRLRVKDGEGGGWLADQPDEITALYSFGYYLLVFLRGQTKVLAGTNEGTWVFRPLSTVYGAIGPRAVAEHEGLVYFVSDKGLYMTDGTEVREAEGAQNLRNWLRDAVNWETPGGAETDVVLWSFNGFLWIAVPTGVDRLPDRVVVYDPNTKSFWPQDLSPVVAATNRIDGVEQMFFAEPTQVGTMVNNVYAWLGTTKRSQSTRTLPTALTNLVQSPSFEPRRLTDANGRNYTQTAKQAWNEMSGLTSGLWSPTTPKKAYLGPGAARRGHLGLILTGGPFLAGFEAVNQFFPDVDATQHTMSAFIRRGDWRKKRKLNFDDVRFALTAVPIARANHTFTYIGRGWWRVSATYTGNASSRDHGIQVRNGLTVHIDQVMVVKGTLVPYFDGDGGDDVGTYNKGGDRPLVYQYDHPGSQADLDTETGATDDTGANAYAGDDIAWHMRTAWLPFGVLKEERRIRRVWAMVRSGQNATIKMYRNFVHGPANEVENTADDTRPVWHAEGNVIPDSFAVSAGVEGTTSPAAVLGVAIETQPRRIRSHRS